MVFFFGVFNKRLNAKGAFYALVVGFLLGLFRLAIDTPVILNGHSYAEGSFFWIINNTFFQYYSLVIFLISALVMVVVSYSTAPPEPAKIINLTMSTVTDEQKALTKNSYSTFDIVASVVVIVLILAAYLYFTG
ncbi:MAG: hypothetical protein R2771_07745 [Saprospiraceae bacterium]